MPDSHCRATPQVTAVDELFGTHTLPADVAGAIALDEELVRLTKLSAADSAVCWDRVLFCAKETVYKAWFPLTRRWLGFEQASVTIDPPMMGHTEGTFPLVCW